MRNPHLKRVGRWSAVIVILALAGCAAAPVTEDSEKVVTERAKARLAALIDGDVKLSYTFISPASRQLYPWEVYRGGIRVGFWKSARVDKVRCPSAELCEVDVTVEYTFKGSTVPSPLRESWTKQEGQWWYVLKNL